MKTEAYKCDLCGTLFTRTDPEFGFTHFVDKDKAEREDFCPECMASFRKWREERKSKGDTDHS